MREGPDRQSRAVQVFEPGPEQLYPVDAAAYLAGVSRRVLLLYCRTGLIHPSEDAPNGALMFDTSAIHAVRRAEALRASHGISISGVRIIFDLLREVDELRQEVRFLRGR